MTERRTAAELIALAAWLNVPPDRLPPENQTHTCDSSMRAWRRVAEALIEYATIGHDSAIMERDELSNQLDSARHSISVLEKRVATLMLERQDL